MPNRRAGSLIEAVIAAQERGDEAAARTPDDVDFPENRQEVGALRPMGHHLLEDVERAHLLGLCRDVAQLLHPLGRDEDNRVGLIKPFELEDVRLRRTSHREDRTGFDRLLIEPVDQVEQKSRVVVRPNLELASVRIAEDELLDGRVAVEPARLSSQPVGTWHIGKVPSSRWVGLSTSRS